MAKPFESYRQVTVESYVPNDRSGLHGKVHIRPVAGQGYAENLHVECSKRLSADYPVGTQFVVRAKLTDRDDGGEYLYSYHGWPVTVVGA